MNSYRGELVQRDRAPRTAPSTRAPSTRSEIELLIFVNASTRPWGVDRSNYRFSSNKTGPATHAGAGKLLFYRIEYTSPASAQSVRTQDRFRRYSLSSG